MIVLILYLHRPVRKKPEDSQDADNATTQRSVVFVAFLGQSDFLSELVIRLHEILKLDAHCFSFLLIIDTTYKQLIYISRGFGGTIFSF